ncbi:MAG: serine protease [Gemmataceae bacterium]
MFCRSTATVVVLGLAVPAFAQPDAGVRVYRDTLKSTVWIRSERGNLVASGTGSLIDRRRHLILTNYHVVGDVDRVTVYFPTYEVGDSKPVAEKEYYEKRSRQLGVRGRVVARDKQADLALIQIDRVPEGAQALTLAPDSPMPGQPVHSVGNPGKSGALWVYTPGKVRQVYHKKWRAKLESGVVQFEAKIVETDSPTNAGDSGGPLVNDKAELVGVTQGGSLDAQSLSLFVDVSEVKRFLATRTVRDIPSMGPAEVARAEAKPIKDEGKFFSSEAIAKANEDVRQIAHRFGKELLIETYATVPERDVERVKAMSAKEREDYFRDWARQRERAERIEGIVVLICREPTYLYFDITESARSLISSSEFRSIRSKLIENFRAKRYDEGLAELTKLVRDALAERRP